MPVTVVATLLPDLEATIAEWIDEQIPTPEPDGTLSAEVAHAYYASTVRTLLAVAAARALDARRVGLRFNENDLASFVREHFRQLAARPNPRARS